jgi:hypothetical protein
MHVRFLPWLVLVFLPAIASPLPSANSGPTPPEELSDIVKVRGPDGLERVTRTRQMFVDTTAEFAGHAFAQGDEVARLHIVVSHPKHGFEVSQMHKL